MYTAGDVRRVEVMAVSPLSSEHMIYNFSFHKLLRSYGQLILVLIEFIGIITLFAVS